MPGTAAVQADDEVVDQSEELQDEQERDEGSEADDADQGGEQQGESEGRPEQDGSDEDGVDITIGDEPPQGSQEEQPEALVPKLRRLHRDETRKRQELERELAALKAGSQPEQSDDPGPRPTLADNDYDEDKHADAVIAWQAKKADIEARQRAKKEAKDAEAKAWQTQVESYQKLKTELKVPDIDDAEAAVFEALSEIQRGIIVASADNPAVVVYALAQSEKHLGEVSKIADPLKFAKAIWKLEQTVKVTPRKTQTPPPEKRVTGTAPITGKGDGHLERLRAEADKTGDRTKVLDYQRRQRAA